MDRQILDSKTAGLCVGVLFAQCIVSSYTFLEYVVQKVRKSRRLRNLKRRAELGDYEASLQIVQLSPNLSIKDINNHLITPAVWGIKKAKLLLAHSFAIYGHDDVGAEAEDRIARSLETFRQSHDLMEKLHLLNIRMVDSSRSKEVREKVGNIWVDEWNSEFDAYGTRCLEELAKILDSVLKRDQTFVDPSFEPTYKSLCTAGKTIPSQLNEILVSWRRPRDIGNPFAKVQLFAKGVSPHDVCQGLVGNCFLMATLSSLAVLHRREVWDIRKLIDDRFAHMGLYGVKLFVRGRWITIPIDDYFPVFAMTKYKTAAQSQNRRWESCFSSISNYDNSVSSRKELWCPLIEKAYSKLSGSYAASDGMGVGSLGYILNTLTGGDAERVDSESPEMWNKITSSPCNCMIGSLRADYAKTFSDVSIDSDSVSSEGLVLNHVYSVIDWLEKDGVKLIRVRNPWGELCWNGKYSKRHASWNEHATLLDHARAAEIKMGAFMNERQKENAAKIHAQTGSISYLENDGMFWMQFEDFCKRFDVFVCDLSEERRSHTVRGEWKMGVSAGGRPKTYRAAPSIKKLELQLSSSPVRRIALRLTQKAYGLLEQNATFSFLRHVDTFRFNEKFLLRVRAGSKFTITLNQPDHRRDSSSWSNPGTAFNAYASTVASLFLLHPSSLDLDVEEKKVNDVEEKKVNDGGSALKKKYPPIEVLRSGYCQNMCGNLYTHSKYRKTSVISKKEKEEIEDREKKKRNESEPPSLGLSASCVPKAPSGLPDKYPVDEYIVCASAWRTGLEAEYWISVRAKKGYEESVLSFEPLQPRPSPMKLVERQAMSRSGGPLGHCIQCMEAGDADTWIGISSSTIEPLWTWIKGATFSTLTHIGLVYFGYTLFKSRTIQDRLIGGRK